MRIFYKIILSLSFFCLVFLSLGRVFTVFAQTAQVGTGGNTLNGDLSGNISLGGASTSTAKFQIVPLASNTYGLKVVDSGNNSLFTVTPSGVVVFASSTTISGGINLSNGARFSGLSGSAGQCLSTNSLGVVALVTCGSSGPVSTAASLITSNSTSSGAFNNLAGTGGNYSFPANLSINSATVPTGGVLYVNGNVGINKSNPSTALDVTGTVTSNQFAGGGAGVTGVTAATVPWSGVSSRPTTFAGYGITDISAWAKASTKPSYAFSELTGSSTAAQLAGNININTTGQITAGQFVGGGAGITGVSASSVPWTGITGRPTAVSTFTNGNSFITANQTITLSGAVTGSGTTAITTTMGTNNNYPVTAGNGNGFCFSNNCTLYKIALGTGSDYWYGPVSDYSLKNTMSYCEGDTCFTDRGFVWGVAGLAPVAALNTLTGALNIANIATSGTIYSSGNLNVAGRPYTDGYNVNAGSIAAWNQIYGYTAICTGNASGNCNSTGGTVIGLANSGAANNIPDSGTIFFTGGNVAIGKTSAATALDVNGTVTASTGFAGSGAGLTGVDKVMGTSYYNGASWNTQWDSVCQGVNAGYNGVCSGTQVGQLVINAADMIPGRVMNLHAYGQYKNMTYAPTPVNFRLDIGAGASQMLMTDSIISSYNVSQNYFIDVTLTWVSATSTSGVMDVIISGTGGGNSRTISMYNTTISHVNTAIYLWAYGNGNSQYTGQQFTLEYLN